MPSPLSAIGVVGALSNVSPLDYPLSAEPPFDGSAIVLRLRCVGGGLVLQCASTSWRSIDFISPIFVSTLETLLAIDESENVDTLSLFLSILVWDTLALFGLLDIVVPNVDTEHSSTSGMKSIGASVSLGMKLLDTAGEVFSSVLVKYA